jgi:hypothetical protein
MAVAIVPVAAGTPARRADPVMARAAKVETVTAAK